MPRLFIVSGCWKCYRIKRPGIVAIVRPEILSYIIFVVVVLEIMFNLFVEFPCVIKGAHRGLATEIYFATKVQF